MNPPTSIKISMDLLIISLISVSVIATCETYTPQGGDVLIDNYEMMPFKDQRGDESWSSEINSNYAPNEQWDVYFDDNTEEDIAFKCLSYAASSVNDWVNVQYGLIMGEYKSYIHGDFESGTNPRFLEAAYHSRHSSHPFTYSYIPLWARLVAYKDPITKEDVPYRLEGYSNILKNPPSSWINFEDPMLSQPQEFNYSYHEDLFNIGGFIEIPISLEMFRGENDEDRIKAAMEKYGVLLVLTEKENSKINVHSVAIIGYGSDGEGTFFIAHDNYGITAQYKKCRISEIDQAFAFLPKFAWPTFHHDNRRTGFTLLKGDIKNDTSSSLDIKSAILKLDSEQDLYSRTTSADLDSDGNIDTIVAVSDQLTTDETKIYIIEQRKWWDTRSGLKLKEDPIELNEVVLGPVSVGELNEDEDDKELVFGLEDGTVRAFDAYGTEIWSPYNLTPRYSATASNYYQGDVRFTSIADLDNDGTNEVIFAEYLRSPTVADWQGYLYVLDNDGNEIDSILLGNNGANGAISVANIDDDDNSEIIVPTYYGIQVYNYNSGTLSQNWTSSDGKIRGSAVIYDIDRDNEYELIYTTSTPECGPGKTCLNKLYVRDAETGNQETGSPIDLGSYVSLLTPAIGDIDDDGDAEIVISAKTSAGSSAGKILCYERNGSSISACENLNYERTINAAEVSPSIADLDTDGTNEIIFPENDSSSLFIIDIVNNKVDMEYQFAGQIGSAPAIADLDGDGLAEIAVKRAGSPIAILSTMSGFNQMPHIVEVENITAIAGELVDISLAGIIASDVETNELSYHYSQPFNESGLWQTSINDTGNYSILIESSDGNLSDFISIEVIIFNETVQVQRNFSDQTQDKNLSFNGQETHSIEVRIPKDAKIKYSKLKVQTQ